MHCTVHNTYVITLLLMGCDLNDHRRIVYIYRYDMHMIYLAVYLYIIHRCVASEMYFYCQLLLQADVLFLKFYCYGAYAISAYITFLFFSCPNRF